MTAAKGIQLILMSFTIALMGCVCTAQTASVEPSRKKFVERLEDKTIALTDINKEGNMAPYCSGVWVGKNKILTAAHCVDDKPVAFYMVKDDIGADIVRMAVKLRVDENSDLALLMADPETTPAHRTAELSKEKPWAGQKIYIEGHTASMWWTFSEGVVSSNIRTVFEDGKTPAIQISAPAWFGNSGGGAFDDNGDLVGLCSWLSVKGPNLTFFVPNDELKEFLKQKD